MLFRFPADCPLVTSRNFLLAYYLVFRALGVSSIQWYSIIVITYYSGTGDFYNQHNREGFLVAINIK
jgi:hypothetical protein